MTSSKSTKRALLTSALALLMCVAMLVGATFAWFTDTASTGVNKIQAGNLDIEVEYTLDGETWNDLDEATDIFQKGLWEPGHTEVVALKFKNNGNLALKYNINMNIVDETVGINKSEQEYKLSDYLKVKTLSQEASGIGDICIGMAFSARNDGLGYTATANFKDATVLDHDLFLTPGEVGNYLIMKVYMPETVGNEANAISTEKAASIHFGLNVVATQVPYEKDSFGNTYDKDATYPVIVSNQQQANDAITNATDKKANISIASNQTITLDSGIAHEGDKSRDITFSGDGSQTVDVVKEAVNATEGSELNYQRGSSFTFENLTIQAGSTPYGGIVCNELTFKNCTIKGKLTLYGKATFINCVFENDMANQYSIWTWGGTDVTFENCTFNTNGKAILLFGEEKTTNLTVNNCTFNDRTNGAAGKAAIEIGDANYGKHNNFTVVINNSTVEQGFAINTNGTSTGSKLWANKNSMDAAHLTVTIDGSKIQ